MKNLTLEHITDCCHGTYIGTEEQQGFEVTGVVIDSRKVEAGNLFVAIKGERVDGHTFIDAVYEQGAAAVVSAAAVRKPERPLYLSRFHDAGIERYRSFLQKQSGYPSGRDYRKRRKDEYQRNDSIGAFGKISCLKDGR